MSETSTGAPADLVLDPFAFHGFTASCIAGLGGDHPNPDPTYAFHTPYVPVARGHAHFTVRFSNLRARFGTLWLRVHMLPADPGAAARMVTSERLQLNRLVHHGGEAHVRFEAFRGATYALMGLISDRTDAAADEIEIRLDRPFDESQEDDGIGVDEAAETAFGTQAVKSVSQFISLEPPLLASPVSQPFTAAQLREDAFGRWVSGGQEDLEAAWERAYVLQALDRYGMMQPEAKGLMFGAAPSPIIDVLVRKGLKVQHVALARQGLAPPDEQHSGPIVDPDALPEKLIANDFLCSLRATDLFDDEPAAVRFVERSMLCLRPGGLAVHLVTASGGPEDQRDARAPICFDRNALERLALALVSRGHSVARLKPPSAGVAQPTFSPKPFGLIVRRAPSIL